MRGIILCLAICSCLGVNQAFGQGQALPPPVPLSVHGQIRLPGNQPAPQGVSVTLDYAMGGLYAQGQTDSTGRFEFPAVPPDIYELRVRYPGFKEITEQVDLRTTSGAFLNLQLQPLPRSDKNPIPPEGAGATISARLPSNDTAREEYQKAQEILSGDKNTKSGISHLQKAMKAEPSFEPAYVLLGKAYMDQKDWKQAEDTLRKGADLDAKDFAAAFMLGACLNQEKDFAGAEKALQRSLEINPQAVEGHYELARTYLSTNQWQKAEPHVAEAIKLDPNFAPAHVAMGNIFLKKGDVASAQSHYEQYLKLAPDGMFAPGVKDLLQKMKSGSASSKP